MHDRLLGHQGQLTSEDMIRYARELSLNAEQFIRDLRAHAGEAKISRDIDSADLSGVSGTPTFFINGKRHHGAYDIVTLSAAVRASMRCWRRRARARVSCITISRPGRAGGSSRGVPVRAGAGWADTSRWKRGSRSCERT
jgi:hypothetical protein